MRLGYHTSGLLLFDDASAIIELAKIGYQSVALRPRRGIFNPLDSEFPTQRKRVADALATTKMELVLDASSRFVHDARRAHYPSLVSHDIAEQALAKRWLEQLIEVAPELRCSTILVSSVVDRSREQTQDFDDPGSTALDRLAESLDQLHQFARGHGVALAIQPRTDSIIANVAQYERLRQWLAEPHSIQLAADVGEMISAAELPVSERLIRNARSLRCVLLADRTSGEERDCRIGHGDVDLRRLVRSLCELEFSGHAIVRVEGHEALGLVVAEEAYACLSGV